MSGHTPEGSPADTRGSRLIALIEPSEFARRGDVRSGVWRVAELPRLASMSLDPSDHITWQARGELADTGGLMGAEGRFLVLALEGEMTLRCERCLSPMKHPVALRSRLLLVPVGQTLPDEELEQEDFDALPVERELDLVEVIEDELLLSLPVVPRHAQCALPGHQAGGQTRAQAAPQKTSPFEVLAKLKRGH